MRTRALAVDTGTFCAQGLYANTLVLRRDLRPLLFGARARALEGGNSFVVVVDDCFVF